MNENFLYDLLIDPLTGESLVFDNALQTLKGNLSGHSYRLIESVPEIITGDNPDIARSDIHRIYNSYFNYHDHYQKDADNFDYSEMNIPEVTRSENNRLHQSIIHEIPGDLSVVLDVGCGNGWISKELIPLGKKVISMDISSTNPVNAVRG